MPASTDLQIDRNPDPVTTWPFINPNINRQNFTIVHYLQIKHFITLSWIVFAMVEQRGLFLFFSNFDAGVMQMRRSMSWGMDGVAKLKKSKKGRKKARGGSPDEENKVIKPTEDVKAVNQQSVRG